jgi:2,5-diketo-D-gluconate reductase A
MSIPTTKTFRGTEVPTLGIGTWEVTGDVAIEAVADALAAGYRHVDTAVGYQNHLQVAEGLKRSGLARDDYWLTTKIHFEDYDPPVLRKEAEDSLEELGVDYLDLLLLHWPNPGQDRYVDAVLGLERLRERGVVRAIGVSNFKPAHLRRVIEETGIAPEVNQIQLSPYATRAESRDFHAEHGIVTESWSPIGGQSDDLRADPVIAEIAAAHGKSPTQTVLRWHLELGLVTVPKSANPGRIAENFDVFDFSLTPDEVARITALDRGEADVTDSDVFGH